ncbi:MAG: methionine--tRNA ligase [Chloroflexi bacterium]|jgi:methionyl-tRNA synthetase|nr:methionine--tRNA ligase [Chloroflexota bacterium]
MTKKVLVSIAWPYANGDLHIGHLAGAYLPADIYGRYHRLAGNDVLMVSGSDTHGTPVTLQAEQEDISPEEVYGRYHERFLEAQQKIGISYSLFTHTDTPNHHQVAQDMFSQLREQGYLYTETQKQFYSEASERFLPDRYIEGTCPYCGYEEARGDQCDECGKLLDALELGDPRSKVDGSTPVLRETEHFFLDLAKLEPEVLAYLEDDKEDWRTNVIKFSLNYVKDGLRGRPITRDITWGIPVPLDAYESKRLYVWFEAVMGYLSASIEWAKLTGDPEAWKAWWYDPEALTLYFIGKDNIVFHTVIWPAELIGVERLYEDDPNKALNLPYDVPANEFMNLAGTQFSKSRGNMISILDLLARYDADAIRYYITVVMPETSDSDFYWDDFVQRNNSELVGVWGNLSHRVLSFTYKNFEAVPTPGELDDVDRELLRKIEAGFDAVGEQIAARHFRAGLNQALDLAREANRYLEIKAPWKQIKEDREAAATTLYVALQAINGLKLLFAPYLPFSAEKLHRTLGYEEPIFGEQVIQEVTDEGRTYNVLRYDDTAAAGAWAFETLPASRALQKPQPLFKKLDEKVIEEELARMEK